MLSTTRVGKFFLKANQARAACYIHDFEYYLIALQWKPNAIEWKVVRFQADYHLKRNRKAVARWWLAGRIYARLYFRFVRLSGRFAMRTTPHLFMPPTPEALEEIKGYLRLPITRLARDTLARWGLKYESV